MVRGSRRGLAPRLTASILGSAMLIASCAPAGPASTESTSLDATTVAAGTSSSMAPAGTTTMHPVTTTAPNTSTKSPDIGLEVLVPEGEAPFPAVVLVHGGGWVAGSPALMTALASLLTENGYLTVNTGYTLAGEEPGFPTAVDDVACAVRYAAGHPDSDGTVAVIGHSAGAHLSALVALDDGVYGEDCPWEGPVIPGRLVGLAGPYDVARLGPLMFRFFGASPTDDPAAWVAGNPLYQTDNNPGLDSLLLHGENDGFVDLSFATDFSAALTDGGSEVVVEVVEGANHNDMDDPEYVGELILAWLDR